MIGFALAWDTGYLVLAAAGFAACTWLARSLARALICVVAALGLIGALMVLLSSLDVELLGSLGIGWGVMFIAWWLVAVACAIGFRFAQVEKEFALAELLACLVSVTIAAIVASKINFHSDLLFYLVHAEDNAAWVGLSTQAAASSSIGSLFIGTTMGPIMPMLLGLLSSAQQYDVPETNAVFALYTLAIVLTPLAAVTLLRGLSGRPRLPVIAFAAIVFAWAYAVPVLLYTNHGHLSAIWAFLGLLLVISYFAFDRATLWSLPIGLGLLLFLGGVWFPFAPLAACGAIVLALWSVRNSGRGGRLTVVALLGFGVIALIVQLQRSGVPIGTDSAQLKVSLTSLYQSTGGTAAIDPTLLVMTLGGIVALAFFRARTGDPRRPLSALLIAIAAYLIAIYAGSSLLGVGGGYGVTKLTYILAMGSAVTLIAVIPRFTLPSRPLVTLIVVLGLGSFLYGGAGGLLQRSWPGDRGYPVWLAPVETVVSSQLPGHPRPVVCFAVEPFLSYNCTRWAGALTRAGDGEFLSYRLDIVAAGAARGAQAGTIVKTLARNGTLARSDVIFLEKPDKNTRWAQTLLQRGGRVFGPGGKPLKRRSVSAIRR